MFERLKLPLQYGDAICYSGYREGQRPGVRYPSYAEILEDLTILSRKWSYIRLYDCTPHAETVLDVIAKESLSIKVMLGVDMAAEMSNPGCPWGAEFSRETLAANCRANNAHIEKAIVLANRYPNIVFCVSVGNEASVEWTDHMVSVERLVAHAERLKETIKQPITFCENYVPWTYKLEPLAAVLDVISIHTYPAWEYLSVHDALNYTKQNYHSVADYYPDKAVIITEAGWTTTSNGRGIEPHNASEEIQAQYFHELTNWANQEQILTFVFEAFDEPWKGSPDPAEPEKHWGLFNLDRTPKLVMSDDYADLLPIRRPSLRSVHTAGRP